MKIEGEQMGKVNRGKQFEKKVEQSLSRVQDCTITRLQDPMAGFKGIKNICDYIVYKHPCITYLECKCCYGNRLPFSNITETQWEGLLSKSEVYGVRAGIMCWFIDHDLTFFIPIKVLDDMKVFENKHSIHYEECCNNEEVTLIPSVKKRVLCDYAMEDFLDVCL